jgi:hypothetical protein
MSELQGIARFRFHPQGRGVKRLSAQAIRSYAPASRARSSTKPTNGDESEAIVLERYRDSRRSSTTASTWPTSWNRSATATVTGSSSAS